MSRETSVGRCRSRGAYPGQRLMEPIGTCIYGRRMYEMMTYWDTPEAIDEGSGIEYDFPAMTWRAADKIVYSRTSLRFPQRTRWNVSSPR